jgi:LruC domain-containing protein
VKAALGSAGIALAAALALAPGRALAEGSAQTGYNQRLDLVNYALTLKVDARAGETITIAGRPVSSAGGVYPWPALSSAAISAIVTTPAGRVLTLPMTPGAGVLTVARLEELPLDNTGQRSLPVSGANAPLTLLAETTGTYHISFRQTAGSARADLLPYDISIVPDVLTSARPFVPPGGRGRLHSPRWGFDAGAFIQAAATNARYYVNAPGAVAGSSFIWQMDLQGLAGYVYDVVANDTGLDAPYARSSRSRWITPAPKNTPLYEIYLTPPAATNPAVRPEVAFTGSGGNGITLQGSGGSFRFRSNLNGSYQLVLDINRDGVFDSSTGSADAILAGRAVPGVNDALWDGRDAGARVVPAGSYAAKLFLRVGEFHFVAYDDENNYPGLAIFRIDAETLAGSPTLLFWDDRQVPVPDGSRRSGGGAPSLLSTLPAGVLSSTQRHAWGNTWVSNSFGNEAYVDSWVIGDESSQTISIEVQAPGADLDGDGIANLFDEYPCDAAKSASVFIPSAGSFGMVMFEDLWPSDGDFDFNDTIVGYNYELVYGAPEQLTAIRATFSVLAVGASIHSGLGLHLPIPAAAVSQVHRRIGTGGTDVPVVRSTNGELVLRVVNDLRASFPADESFVNTRTAEPVRTPLTITLLIELNQAVQIPSGQAPFDLFLYWTHDPAHEIHRPMYAGTELMDTALFGTMSDGSTDLRHFVNDRGVPFALDVPQSTMYPLEQHPIDWLYPDILAFGSSGGASSRSYYASNVQLAHAYRGDVFGAPRAQAVLPPRVEVYARGCRRVFE